MNSTELPVAAWPVHHVVCPLQSRDATGAIHEIAATLADEPGVRDLAALIQALASRETLSPTYLGGGVAMPHARTSAVDRLVIAVGLAPAGLFWGSPRELARLVFLVGIPRDDDGRYLEMVRRITQTIRRLDWLEKAVRCVDRHELARVLGDSIRL